MEIKRERSEHLDLLAGILICYVIFVHACQFFHYDSSTTYLIMQHVVGWFMPWFFFKGGMFYKDCSVKDTFKIGVKRLIVPYVIWTVIGTLVLAILSLCKGNERTMISFVKEAITGILYSGSAKGNLALWFLLSLFLARMIFCILYKLKMPILFIVIVSFSVGFICNIYDLRTPRYFANAFTGTMFYSLGYILRKVQYGKYQMIVSIVIYAIITLFAYTYVGMRKNMVYEGYYSLWPLYAVSGIFFYNNILKRFEEISTHAQFRKSMGYIFCYIGKNSMAIYVSHWVILIIVESLIS